MLSADLPEHLESGVDNLKGGPQCAEVSRSHRSAVDDWDHWWQRRQIPGGCHTEGIRQLARYGQLQTLI